jgi:hypothetical protein
MVRNLGVSCWELRHETSRAMRWREEYRVMAIADTAVPSQRSTQVCTSDIWSLAGLFLALLVNAAWIGFLGYCVVRLII